MRRIVPLVALLAAFSSLLFTGPAAAQAGVVARISLSSQRMEVYVDGEPRYNWPVSTARRGYRTPTGTFQPTALAVWHRSTIYSGSPMPLFDLLPAWLCHPRLVRNQASRAPREPWLCEAASVQCQGAVLIGQSAWPRQHAHPDHALVKKRVRSHWQSLCGGAPRNRSPNQLSAAFTLFRAA